MWREIYHSIHRLKRRSERATEVHRQTLRQVRNITASLDEGVLLLDEKGNLDWWNSVANQLLNLQKADRNQHIATIIRSPAFHKFIRQSAFSDVLEITAPNNPMLSFMFSAARLESNNIVLIVRDTTQLRQLENVRRDFVANISHELRTPLTVISGYIETLMDNVDTLPPGWQKALQQMQQQSKRISNLTNDLATLSQLENMDQITAFNPVELQPLLNQIVTDAAALADNEHTLQLDCDPGLVLNGDESELYSAFSNLIFNAIKHTPAGTTVSITAKHEKHAVNVSVSDNGPGIESQHIPRLTERFYRTDSSRTSSTGGTGLGLAIVKHVVLHHRGTLSIKSPTGEGATFTCRFAHQ